LDESDVKDPVAVIYYLQRTGFLPKVDLFEIWPVVYGVTKEKFMLYIHGSTASNNGLIATLGAFMELPRLSK
jgi:hypothetical protein